MIKNLITSFLLLTPFLSFSQISISDVETKEVYSFLNKARDSVFTVKVDTSTYYVVDGDIMTKIVVDLVEGEVCQEYRDSLLNIINLQSNVSAQKDTLIYELKVKDKINKEKSDLQEEVNKSTSKALRKAERKAKISADLNKFLLPIVGAVAIVEGVILIVNK